jgi:hypothetical protein
MLDNQLLCCDSLTDSHISVSSVDMFCTFTYSSKFYMEVLVLVWFDLCVIAVVRR